jgi:phenylalanine ammonia-lyase
MQKLNEYSDCEKATSGTRETIFLDGTGLSINDLMRIARDGCRVSLSNDQVMHERIEGAHKRMQKAAADNEIIYGVTTGFGGMANVLIPPNERDALQDNMLWYHKAGAGRNLPFPDVRAAMVLRANSHLRGASGPRLELIQRLLTFVNAGVTPHVPDLGSIGASGDLVPLTYIAGAVIGHEAGFSVDFQGATMDATTALRKLDLPRLRLEPKEALAMLNGTSACTAIAAGCIHEARKLVELAIQAHALMLQGLHGTDLSFHKFIHDQKPHEGQSWTAACFRDLLNGSGLIRHADGINRNPSEGLVQDRYSLRCLPQFMGPIVDGLKEAALQIEVEMNSTTDNPLIDVDNGNILYGGNFLAQYTGMAMDRLRYSLSLVAKHLDVQIAQLVAPEFNNGLSPSLVGNRERHVNMGLKGLQISANSIAPLVSFFGNSLADRFPTHAEQFNQNINSQAFGSANLARQSVELLRQLVSMSLIFGLQSVDLRTYEKAGHYDARKLLAPAMLPLYTAIREITGTPASMDRPWLWDDNQRTLDLDVALIFEDIKSGTVIARASAVKL